MSKKLIPKNVLEQAVSLRNSLEVGFLRLGEILKDIRDSRHYEGIHESFEDFLNDKMKMSKGTASRLIQIHEYFVLKHKIPEKVLAEVGWGTLYDVQRKLPEGIKKAEVVEWVEKGKHLTRHDITREVSDLTSPPHKHDFRELHLRVCKVPNCNYREKIYD